MFVLLLAVGILARTQAGTIGSSENALFNVTVNVPSNVSGESYAGGCPGT